MLLKNGYKIPYYMNVPRFTLYSLNDNIGSTNTYALVLIPHLAY